MEELLKKLFVITTIAITFLSSFSYLVSVRVFKGISFGFTVRKLRLLEVKLLDRDPYISNPRIWPIFILLYYSTLSFLNGVCM